MRGFISESRKIARELDPIIPVYDYAESHCGNKIIQASYMFLAHDMPLSKWLKKREGWLSNNGDRAFGRWVEDSLAVALGYTTTLFCLLCESFVHGDPHSDNVFIPIKNDDTHAVNREWREIVLPFDIGEMADIRFHVYTSRIKFIDSGSSEYLKQGDNELHSESVNREIERLRITILNLLTPKDQTFLPLCRNDLKRVIPHIEYEEWRTSTNDLKQMSTPAFFLQEYELCVLSVVKELQVAFLNREQSPQNENQAQESTANGIESKDSECTANPQSVAIDDIGELNELIFWGTQLRLGFDFDYLINHCLLGMLVTDSGLPYRFERSMLRV